MYASAMKFCGAMELCGIGFPCSEPMDHDWPAVEAQIKAQNAAQVIAYSRDHKPEEAEFLQSKGFVSVSLIRNPRTGTLARLWILTLPQGERPAESQPVEPSPVLPRRGQVINLHTLEVTEEEPNVVIPF